MSKKTESVTITAPVAEPSKRYWKFDNDPKSKNTPGYVGKVVGGNYFLQDEFPDWKDAVAVEITFKPVFKQ